MLARDMGGHNPCKPYIQAILASEAGPTRYLTIPTSQGRRQIAEEHPAELKAKPPEALSPGGSALWT